MNIKQIKSVLIKIWAIVFLVLFSTWLIGGCIYNSIGKESIQGRYTTVKTRVIFHKAYTKLFCQKCGIGK